MAKKKAPVDFEALGDAHAMDHPDIPTTCPRCGTIKTFVQLSQEPEAWWCDICSNPFDRST
jgi:hypothetical protein